MKFADIIRDIARILRVIQISDDEIIPIVIFLIQILLQKLLLF